MPTPSIAVAVAIDGDVYELEAATTKGVTLIHRVTGDTRTVTHAELANIRFVPLEGGMCH
ncbi:hypothetical protein JM654_19275 [Microbacterium oxydans]|nr:hypothetical protein [Microbacterium oxydans]